MKRPAAATIAFYIGVLSLFVGVVVYGGGFQNVIKAKPSSFVEFANCWFLITIACYANEIYRYIVSKPK